MDKYGDVSGTDAVLNEKKSERTVRKKKGRLAMLKRLLGKVLGL